MQIIAWAMGLTVKNPPNLEVFLLVNCVHGDTLLPKFGVYSVFATTGSLYPDLMIGVKLSLTWLLSTQSHRTSHLPRVIHVGTFVRFTSLPVCGRLEAMILRRVASDMFAARFLDPKVKITDHH